MDAIRKYHEINLQNVKGNLPESVQNSSISLILLHLTFDILAVPKLVIVKGLDVGADEQHFYPLMQF